MMVGISESSVILCGFHTGGWLAEQEEEDERGWRFDVRSSPRRMSSVLVSSTKPFSSLQSTDFDSLFSSSDTGSKEEEKEEGEEDECCCSISLFLSLLGEIGRCCREEEEEEGPLPIPVEVVVVVVVIFLLVLHWISTTAVALVVFVELSPFLLLLSSF